MIRLLFLTCLLFSQVIGELCNDQKEAYCKPLLGSFKNKGARISITDANKETELKGTFLAEDDMKVGFTIRINQESTSEFGRGEAYLEGCEGPQQFKVDGDTLKGSWDVKMDTFKIKLYKDKMLKFDYPFNDECSKKLKGVKWTGLTVGGFGEATLNVDYPPSDFEECGYQDEGGRACNFDKSDPSCNKGVLTKFGTRGAALYVSTTKRDAKVVMVFWDMNDEQTELEINIDQDATEAEKRGAARIGECGKGTPYPVNIPFDVDTLTGEWVVQLNKYGINVWFNRMQVIDFPFSGETCASKLETTTWKAVSFKNIDADYMDIYFYYPETDVGSCQWEMWGDDNCRNEPNEKGQCFADEYPYCGCGKMLSNEDKCSTQNRPLAGKIACECPQKCYWREENGMCKWDERENKCIRRTFPYCSCDMRGECDKDQKPKMRKEHCDEYECMNNSSSSKLMGTSTLFLLIALAYRTAF